MTEYLQNQIESTLKGIKIKIKIVPYKSRLQLDQDQKYQLELTRWGPDYQDPMTFLANQITDNNYNRASYSNKEYDKLLKEASTTLATKPEERWNAMLKAEKVLLDDAGIAPIYQSGTAALQKPTLKGYTTHLFGPPTSYRSIEWSK
ncbi:Periplasmic murein peptide-binding protein precursor [Listeria grayi]|nr:Periplasmic murein peptide-binding protein precursor [Listeria grayi]